MFCNQNAYAPKSLDYKGLQPRRIHTQTGSTSRKTISKHNILRPYFDYDFSDAHSNRIAQDFERYIKETRKYKKETPIFVEDILNKVLYLHKVNLKVSEVTLKYPLTRNFTQLLLHYVALECNVLYRREYYTPSNEITVEKRVLRLLLTIYNSYYETLMSLPPKKLFQESAKAVLTLLIRIKPEFDIQNKLIENIVIKLLRKLGELEKITALKGKCIPCPLDTYLSDPTLLNTYKNIIITSDYGTDDDLKIEDEEVQVETEEERNNDSVDVKLEIDDLLRISNRLNQRSVGKPCTKVPTVYIDDDDEHMISWEEEIKTSDKSCKRKEEDKEKELIRREKQNQAFSRHKPIKTDLPLEIKTDVKDEVIDLDVNSEDELSTSASLTYTSNSHSVYSSHNAIISDEVVVIEDNSDETSKPVSFKANNSGNITHSKEYEILDLSSSDEDAICDKIPKEKEDELLRDEDEVFIVEVSEPLNKCAVNQQCINEPIKMQVQMKKIAKNSPEVLGNSNSDVNKFNKMLRNDEVYSCDALAPKIITTEAQNNYATTTIIPTSHKTLSNATGYEPDHVLGTRSVRKKHLIDQNEWMELTDFESYYVLEARREKENQNMQDQIIYDGRDASKIISGSVDENKLGDHISKSATKNENSETKINNSCNKLDLNDKENNKIMISHHNATNSSLIKVKNFANIKEIDSDNEGREIIYNCNKEVELDKVTNTTKAVDEMCLSKKDIDSNQNKSDKKLIKEDKENINTVLTKGKTFIEGSNVGSPELDLSKNLQKSFEEMGDKISPETCETVTIDNIKTDKYDGKIPEVTERKDTEQGEDNSPDTNEKITFAQFSVGSDIQEVTVKGSTTNNNTNRSDDEIDESTTTIIEEIVEETESVVSNNISEQSLTTEKLSKELTEQVNSSCTGSPNKEYQYNELGTNFSKAEIVSISDNQDLLTEKNDIAAEVSVCMLTDEHEINCLKKEKKIPIETDKQIPVLPANSKHTTEANETNVGTLNEDVFRCKVRESEDLAEEFISARPEDLETIDVAEEQVTNENKLMSIASSNEEHKIEKVAKQIVKVSTMEEDLNQSIKTADHLAETSSSDESPSAFDKTEEIDKYPRDSSISEDENIEETQQNMEKNQEIIEKLDIEKVVKQVVEGSTTEEKDLNQSIEVIEPLTETSGSNKPASVFEKPDQMDKYLKESSSGISEGVSEDEKMVDPEGNIEKNQETGNENSGALEDIEKTVNVNEENKIEKPAEGICRTSERKLTSDDQIVADVEATVESVDDIVEMGYISQLNIVMELKETAKFDKSSKIMFNNNVKGGELIQKIEENPGFLNTASEQNENFIIETPFETNDTNVVNLEWKNIPEKSIEEKSVNYSYDIEVIESCEVEISEENTEEVGVLDSGKNCNEIELNEESAESSGIYFESDAVGIEEKQSDLPEKLSTETNLSQPTIDEKIQDKSSTDCVFMKISEEPAHESDIYYNKTTELHKKKENLFQDPVAEINLNDVTVNKSSKDSFENVCMETEQSTNDSDSDYLEKELMENIESTEISSSRTATKECAEVSEEKKINIEVLDTQPYKQNSDPNFTLVSNYFENEVEQLKEKDSFTEISSSRIATEESPEVSDEEKIKFEVLDTQMSKESSKATLVSEVIKPVEGKYCEKKKVHQDADCTEHLDMPEDNQLNQAEIIPPVEDIDLKTIQHLDVLEKPSKVTDAHSEMEDHSDDICSQNNVPKDLDRSYSTECETHNQEINCNNSETINLDDQIHDDLKNVEYVNDLNIQKEEVIGETGTLESHISEETVIMDPADKSIICVNPYDKVTLKDVGEDDIALHNQTVSQTTSLTDIPLDASDSLQKKIDALKKIGTEILVANNSQQFVPEEVVQDLDICKIPNENTSLDILATVATEVSRQDLLRSKSNKKSIRRGRKKRIPLKIKSVHEEAKQTHKKRTKIIPVSVDAENKRITRSSHIRTNEEQKCRPHDFLVNNSKVLPPANNIYIHKLAEINLTSEDSNDSEGNLFIDEEVDLKGSKPKETPEENSVNVQNLTVVEKLTHYDEDTLEEEVICPCKPKVKGTVLISIPDNYQDNFEILKQIEEMDNANSKHRTVFTEESTKQQADIIQENVNGAFFDRNFDATDKTVHQLHDNVSENITEIAKMADNSYTCIEVADTVYPSEDIDLIGRNHKPFRTMAERKDYDKFELNPYVSIERLNIYPLKEKGEQEEVYKKTRSKSFDIGIIRRTVLDVGETDQPIHFKDAASSQSSVTESKTTKEISSEAPKPPKELDKQALTDCNKNQYTKDNLEDKDNHRNNAGNTNSSDLDDIPLLQRAQNKSKRRYGPRIVVKKKKEKIGRKNSVNENKPKHESSGKIKKKKVKVTKKEEITETNDNANYIATKLRRKSITYENPKNISSSCISQDQTCEDNPNADASTDFGTNSEELPLEKKHEGLNDNKNKHSTSQIEMESKENQFIKKDNEVLNKSSKKTKKDISEEEMVKSSNKKYYTTPKLRRKSVSKDTLNIMKQVVLDMKRIGDVGKSGNPTSDTLTFSPDKKYYTPPKLRMKPMIENANIKDMIAKKAELTELKPTTEIDMLLRCKNTVSTTTEKLKKKLEIDFKLKHQDIFLEGIAPISNKSEHDNTVLVNAPQMGYNESDLSEERCVISKTEEARNSKHEHVYGLIKIGDQSVELQTTMPKYDLPASTLYDQRISEEKLDIPVEKEGCVSDQNKEIDVHPERADIYIEKEVCVSDQNKEIDGHSEKVDNHVEKVCVSDQNEEIDGHSGKVDNQVEKVCLSDLNEEIDEHSEKVNIHVEKDVWVSDQNEEIDLHPEKVNIHVEKEVCVSNQNEEINEHSEKVDIHVEKDVCVSDQNEEIDVHPEKVNIHNEKEVCVSDQKEDIAEHLEKINEGTESIQTTVNLQEKYLKQSSTLLENAPQIIQVEETEKLQEKPLTDKTPLEIDDTSGNFVKATHKQECENVIEDKGRLEIVENYSSEPNIKTKEIEISQFPIPLIVEKQTKTTSKQSDTEQIIKESNHTEDGETSSKVQDNVNNFSFELKSQQNLIVEKKKPDQINKIFSHFNPSTNISNKGSVVENEDGSDDSDNIPLSERSLKWKKSQQHIKLEKTVDSFKKVKKSRSLTEFKMKAENERQRRENRSKSDTDMENTKALEETTSDNTKYIKMKKKDAIKNRETLEETPLIVKNMENMSNVHSLTLNNRTTDLKNSDQEFTKEGESKLNNNNKSTNQLFRNEDTTRGTDVDKVKAINKSSKIILDKKSVSECQVTENIVLNENELETKQEYLASLQMNETLEEAKMKSSIKKARKKDKIPSKVTDRNVLKLHSTQSYSTSISSTVTQDCDELDMKSILQVTNKADRKNHLIKSTEYVSSSHLKSEKQGNRRDYDKKPVAQSKSDAANKKDDNKLESSPNTVSSTSPSLAHGHDLKRDRNKSHHHKTKSRSGSVSSDSFSSKSEVEELSKGFNRHASTKHKSKSKSSSSNSSKTDASDLLKDERKDHDHHKTAKHKQKRHSDSKKSKSTQSSTVSSTTTVDIPKKSRKDNDNKSVKSRSNSVNSDKSYRSSLQSDKKTDPCRSDRYLEKNKTSEEKRKKDSKTEKEKIMKKKESRRYEKHRHESPSKINAIEGVEIEIAEITEITESKGGCDEKQTESKSLQIENEVEISRTEDTLGITPDDILTTVQMSDVEEMKSTSKATKDHVENVDPKETSICDKNTELKNRDCNSEIPKKEDDSLNDIPPMEATNINLKTATKTLEERLKKSSVGGDIAKELVIEPNVVEVSCGDTNKAKDDDKMVEKTNIRLDEQAEVDKKDEITEESSDVEYIKIEKDKTYKNSIKHSIESEMVNQENDETAQPKESVQKIEGIADSSREPNKKPVNTKAEMQDCTADIIAEDLIEEQKPKEDAKAKNFCQKQESCETSGTNQVEKIGKWSANKVLEDKIPGMFKKTVERNNGLALEDKEKSASKDDRCESSTKNEINAFNYNTVFRPTTDLLDIQERAEYVGKCRQSVANPSLTESDRLLNSIPNPKIKKVHNVDSTQAKLKNIQDAFEKYLPSKSKENKQSEEKTNKLNLAAETGAKPEYKLTSTSNSSLLHKIEGELNNRKRRANILDDSSSEENIASTLDGSNKKPKLEEINIDISSSETHKQHSPSSTSPKKKERKSIEFIISHLMEEKASNSPSCEEISKSEVNFSNKVDNLDVKMLKKKLLLKIKKFSSDQVSESSKTVTNFVSPTVPESMETTNILPRIPEGVENIHGDKKPEIVDTNGHQFEKGISLNNTSSKTEIGTGTSTNNNIDTSKGLIDPAAEIAEIKHYQIGNTSDNIISPSSEITCESSNPFTCKDTPSSENILQSVTTTTEHIDCDKTEIPEATRGSDSVIVDSLTTKIEEHNMKKIEEQSCQQTQMNDIIDASFVDDSLNISSVESTEIESLNPCTEDFSSSSTEDTNILNLRDLMMHVDADQTTVTNMGEITVSPEDVCMLSDIISTTIASAENKLPCVSSPGHIKLFTFPVTSQANIKDQFMPLKDVAVNKNILDQTNTSAEKLVSQGDKDCVFSFNEQIGNSRSQTLTSTTLPLNLQDVSFSKIPMGSTQTLDLISPKTLTVVPTSSSRNFMNEVPGASEISDMSTEITGFDEADDHNYTLGGPLLSGRPEEKNILSSSFNKSLDDSPDEFPLNDNPLQELSEFGDNNLREIITDDTYKLNLDNEYAVKAVVMLGGQTSSDPNVFPLSNYNLADIEKINLIDCSVSNSEDNSNSKEYLESPTIEHEVKSETSDVNPWSQFISNENCNQKVVVLTNEQCISPSFSISHSDLIHSFTDHIVETTGPITATIGDICSPLKAAEETLKVNSNDEPCSEQKTPEAETSKEIKDSNISKSNLQKGNKNIFNKPAQKDSPENDFLPKRRYGRTVLRAPPKKKAPPTPPINETKKEEVIENTNIVQDEVSSSVLASTSPSLTSTNTTLLLTEQSISVGDAPLMILGEVLRSDLQKNSVDYIASNDTKSKPRTDLAVPERGSKKKSPQYHLQGARSPLQDLPKKKSTSARQNQPPSSILSRSPIGQIFDEKLPQKQPESKINSRDSVEKTPENMNNQLKVSEKKLEIQSNIADLVKSRKRAATNKYSNNYSMPNITVAKEVPIKTTDTAKSKLTSPLPENMPNNTEMRLKAELMQLDQEHKMYSPRSYNRGHKSPATQPLVISEDKRKSAYQNYSDMQKKEGDTLNIRNSSKEPSNLCETPGNKKSSSQSSIPAETCKKPVDCKYNYSIDSILSKDSKSYSNYMYENPVKDYRLSKNRGMKRNTTTTEEEEKKMGRVDKKQMKVYTNSPQQSKDSKDPFDKLREQGNINKNICLRVTEDNKLKTERRNSPQIKYYVRERNEKDHHQSRSSFHPAYDRSRVSTRREEERRSNSKSRSCSSYQPPYPPTRHKTKEGYLVDYNKGREGYYSDHIRGREGYQFSHRREAHQSDHVRGMGGPHFEHSSVPAPSANRIQANISRSSNVSELYYRNSSSSANPIFHPTTSQSSGLHLKRNAILSPEKQTELLNSLKDKVLDQLSSIDRRKNEDEGEFSWIDKLSQRIDTNLLGPSTATVPQFIPKTSSPRNDRK